MRIPSSILALCVVMGAISAQASTPFRINETTPHAQVAATLAPLPGGGFVAAWMSRETFPPGPPAVLARRFDAVGWPPAGEFPVSTPGGEHWSPVAVADSLGASVIVWRAFDPPSRVGIYGRHYNAAGTEAGAEIELVAGFTAGHDISMGPSGESVLVWAVQDDTTRVWARTVDVALTPGPAVLVAEYPEQFAPFVGAARRSSGGYAVTWTAPTGAFEHDVRARAFDSVGSPITPEILVSAQSGGDPDLVANAAGDITVVWWWSGDYSSPSSVLMRRFDAAGMALGGATVIDDGIGSAAVPAIAIDGDGDLAVAWATRYGSASGADAWQIRGRRFLADGTPAGTSVLVSAFHPDAIGSGSLYPDALLRDDGAIVAAWTETSFDEDGDVYGSVIPVLASSATIVPGRALLANHPNPFNPVTTIRYLIETAGPATLRIYDVAGRRLRTLADTYHSAGVFDIDWDGRDDAGQPVASGVYLYRLDASGASATRKMVLVK